MGQILYLISCGDRDEDNLGLMKDSRTAKADLQKILQRCWNSELVTVYTLQSVGENMLAAECEDDVGDAVVVYLDRIEVWDI